VSGGYCIVPGDGWDLAAVLAARGTFPAGVPDQHGLHGAEQGRAYGGRWLGCHAAEHMRIGRMGPPAAGMDNAHLSTCQAEHHGGRLTCGAPFRSH